MILVGTAGYAYRDWKGAFYPPGLAERNMLPYYAERFDFVEINTTFYRMPTAPMLEGWRDRTPGGFLFVIKAPRLFTHEREDATPQRYGEFRTALVPLVEAGRLGGILAQFPSSFRRDDAARDHLRELRDGLAGLPVAVEFRHREWVNDGRTFDLLEEEGLAYVCVDEPQFKTLVPPVLHATADFGYVRFHGRNYKKWWVHEKPEERYDYLYSEEELAEWVPRLRTLERAAGRVYASMNNHRGGQAAINGRMLKELLELGRVATTPLARARTAVAAPTAAAPARPAPVSEGRLPDGAWVPATTPAVRAAPPPDHAAPPPDHAAPAPAGAHRLLPRGAAGDDPGRPAPAGRTLARPPLMLK